MNRRDFIKGIVALPAIAQLGAVERFLVGRSSAPDVAAVTIGVGSMVAMFTALPWLLDLIDREAQKKEKEPIMRDAIQALDEAIPCGEPFFELEES